MDKIKTDTAITFPAPGGDYGAVQFAIVPNPKRRWWTFWRPRAITIELETQTKVSSLTESQTTKEKQ